MDDQTLAAWLATAGAVGGVAAALIGLLTLRYVRKQDRRETASRDVSWSLMWMSPGSFRVINHGTIEAHNVSVTLTVDSAPSSGRADVVDPEAFVEVFSTLDEELCIQASEIDEAAEREAAEAEPGWFGQMRAVGRVAWQKDVTALIVWTYPSGLHDRHEISQTRTY